MPCLIASRPTNCDTDPVNLTADVLVREDATDSDIALVRDAFSDVGITARVRVLPVTRSMAEVAWAAFAAVSLQPFFSQLATDFADDSYQRLKALVAKVTSSRRAREHPAIEPDDSEPAGAKPDGSEPQPKRVLVLMDEATGVQVVLEPDLPAESFRQLLTFDLATIRRGPLHYDLARQCWRSELDEQAP